MTTPATPTTPDPNVDPNVVGDDPGVDPNATPQTPTSDPTGGDPTPGDQIPATPAPDDKMGGVQKKINKLTKRASRAELEAAYWRGIAEGRTQDQGRSDPAHTTPPAKASGLKRDDFDTEEEYIDAVVAKQAAERAETERSRKQLEKVKYQYEKARTTYSDFDDVALAEDLPVNKSMWDAMQGDHMPDILYRLGSAPKLAAQIAGMSAVQAVKAIGRIEDEVVKAKAKAEPAPNPAPNPASQAPAPVPGIKASPATSPKVPSDRKERFKQWDADRADKIKKRAGVK